MHSAETVPATTAGATVRLPASGAAGAGAAPRLGLVGMGLAPGPQGDLLQVCGGSRKEGWSDGIRELRCHLVPDSQIHAACAIWVVV